LEDDEARKKIAKLAGGRASLTDLEQAGVLHLGTSVRAPRKDMPRPDHQHA